MKKKTLLLLLLFIILLVLAWTGYNYLSSRYSAPDEDSGSSQEASGKPESNEDDTTSERSPAPDFTVYDEAGNEITLSSLQGKTVVLNFWASWCGPCKQEMADFQSVYDSLGDDVVFMMINLIGSNGETHRSAQAFLEEEGYSFPVYYDEEAEAAHAYQISAIPSTFIIDPQGNVSDYQIGVISESALVQKIADAD